MHTLYFVCVLIFAHTQVISQTKTRTLSNSGYQVQISLRALTAWSMQNPTSFYFSLHLSRIIANTIAWMYVTNTGEISLKWARIFIQGYLEKG